MVTSYLPWAADPAGAGSEDIFDITFYDLPMASESDNRTTLRVYCGLLSYTKPYRTRLVIGILAGLCTGGSLFGVFTLLPELVRPFESTLISLEAQTAAGAATAQDGRAATATGLAMNAAAPAADQSAAHRGAASNSNSEGRIKRVAAHFGIPTENPESGTITWQFMLLAIIFMTFVFFLKALFTYANRYYMRWVGNRVIVDLRNDLFATLQNQSLKFYGRCDVGKLISRCMNDTGEVASAVSRTIADLTRAPAEILAAALFIIIFALQTKIYIVPIAMFIVMPLCALPILIYGRKIKRYTRKYLDRIADLYTSMHENFTCIRIVKACNTEVLELDRFRGVNIEYFRKIIKAVRAELMMTPLMEFIGVICAALFLLYCYANGIRLSHIIPIGMAAIAAYRPIKSLTKVNAQLQRSTAAGERIFDVLALDEILPETTNPKRLGQFTDVVRFENVSFAYNENTPEILSNVSFEIPKGKVVAVVGETGSGKTTIANLLARFYDPTDGAITIDGIAIRDMEIASVRSLIGVVTQETILFNTKIADNIAYGSEWATTAEIEEAARQANAHGFIIAEPEGYDRIVGEKGFVLSGGQRQRIAIARAILRNPQILILDEATSALDSVTEQLVQEALKHLMENRTVFTIAHRLSTVRDSYRIFVLADGHIIEQGTHAELSNLNGQYSKLCDVQFS